MPEPTKPRRPGPRPGPPLTRMDVWLHVEDREWLEQERERTGDPLSRIIRQAIKALKKESEKE